MKSFGEFYVSPFKLIGAAFTCPRGVSKMSEMTCFKKTLLVFLTASFSFLSTIKHGATLTSIYLRLELHNFFCLPLSEVVSVAVNCGCTHTSVSHVTMVDEQ